MHKDYWFEPLGKPDSSWRVKPAFSLPYIFRSLVSADVANAQWNVRHRLTVHHHSFFFSPSTATAKVMKATCFAQGFRSWLSFGSSISLMNHKELFFANIISRHFESAFNIALIFCRNSQRISFRFYCKRARLMCLVCFPFIRNNSFLSGYSAHK